RIREDPDSIHPHSRSRQASPLKKLPFTRTSFHFPAVDTPAIGTDPRPLLSHFPSGGPEHQLHCGSIPSTKHGRVQSTGVVCSNPGADLIDLATRERRGGADCQNRLLQPPGNSPADGVTKHPIRVIPRRSSIPQLPSSVDPANSVATGF